MERNPRSSPDIDKTKWNKTKRGETTRNRRWPLVQVPVERVELVKVSLEMGFELHHAEKEYIMLNR